MKSVVHILAIFTIGILISCGAGFRFSTIPNYLYLANFSDGKLIGYNLDPSSGNLTSIPGAANTLGTSASGVVTTPDGAFLYAVSHSGVMKVWGYRISSSTGSLTPLPGSPFAMAGIGRYLCMHPSGRFLYVADGSGFIYGYTIDRTSGSLTANPSSPYLSGAPIVWSVTVIPNGNFLYATELGPDQVEAFSINPITGDLGGGVPASPYGMAFSPWATTTDPASKFLFVTFGNAVDVRAINTSTGQTTDSGSLATGGTTPTGVVTDRTGKYLYIANQVTNNISAFSVSGVGSLTAVTGSPFSSASNVTALSVDLSNQFLFAAGGSPGVIYVHRISSTTGALTQVSTASAGLNPYDSFIFPSQTAVPLW